MFVNPEDSFREGLFYVQITQNLLLYLRMFHKWGPMTLDVDVLVLFEVTIIEVIVCFSWALYPWL